METDERIRYAIENTELVRPPRQALATFGISDIRYYLLTQPVYTDITGNTEDTVIREGRVIAERPKIVIPYYLLNLFQGFEHGGEYADYVLRTYGANEPGLLYRYRNEPSGMNILASPVDSVIENINQEIEGQRPPAPDRQQHAGCHPAGKRNPYPTPGVARHCSPASHPPQGVCL